MLLLFFKAQVSKNESTLRFLFNAVGLKASHQVDRLTLDFGDPENTLNKFRELFNMSVLIFTGRYHFDVTTEDYKSMLIGDEEPFLFHISRGPQKSSLIFHIKIGIFFYELRLDRVFQTSCSFKCTNKSCKARSKMQLLYW